MTLHAHLDAGSVLDVVLDLVPAARMWVGLAAGVALDTDIPLRMAGGTRLQIAACLDGVFADGK